MATTKRTKSEREVRQYLNETGVKYSLRRRKKHIQIIVGGKCISCMSYGNPKGGRRGMKNIFADIDKRVRELNGR